MKCKVLLTDTARDDLRQIAFSVAELTKSKESAIKLVNSLREECKKLEDFPLCGAFPKDRILKSAGYRFLVCGEYLIFYEYDEKRGEAYVLSFFHAARDYMRVMRKFL